MGTLVPIHQSADKIVNLFHLIAVAALSATTEPPTGVVVFIVEVLAVVPNLIVLAPALGANHLILRHFPAPPFPWPRAALCRGQSFPLWPWPFRPWPPAWRDTH